ncbi:hypothetical protein DITRI_Ditri13aG0105700 [Diplodiscus trichospermus]
MNTKMMRLPPRRFSMPTTNKRKQKDDFGPRHLTPPPTKSPKPAVPLAGFDETADLGLSNQLLAGYLAHEFLTRGTLLGQMRDPVRSRQTESESMKGVKEAEPCDRSRTGDAKPGEEKHRRYVEVANLLKGEGAHIPDIVNPSQLARFLQI